MDRFAIACLAACGYVWILFASGCAPKDETTVTLPGGSTVTASKDGQSVAVSTPEGSTKVEGDKVTSTAPGVTQEMNVSVSESDLGYPFYPGSTEAPGGMKMEVQGRQAVTSIRTTADQPAKVLAFYEERLGKASVSGGVDNMVTASWSKDGKVISLVAALEEGKTKVSLSVQDK